MSIWIRSQDGTLAECSRIDAPYEIKSDRDYSVKGKWIIAGASDCVAVKLGYYANKQRAIEVMDEIQEHICGGVILPYLGFGHALFAAIGESEKDDIAKKAMVDAMGVATKLAVFQMPVE